MGSWELSELTTLQPSIAPSNRIEPQPSEPLQLAADDTDSPKARKLSPGILRWWTGLVDSNPEPTA